MQPRCLHLGFHHVTLSTNAVRAASFVALTGIVFLTGCTGAGPDDSASNEYVSEEQLSASSAEVQAALEDAAITRDEYDAGYRSFVACMDEANSPIEEFPMSEDIYQYGIPDAYVQSGAYDECYYYEFYAVDVAWQLAHPTVANRLLTCLVLAGETNAGGTVEKMKARLIQIGEDPEECLATN
jgi:hypothetical protein